jgi:addiction module HigA family antidote
MLPKNRPPTHPGEVLLEEFLNPKGMTQASLAAKLGLPIQRINTIVNKKRGVTPETALLLAKVFETSAEFWMNLQTKYDLWTAARRMTGS